jgi:hypothetical protein
MKNEGIVFVVIEKNNGEEDVWNYQGETKDVVEGLNTVKELEKKFPDCEFILEVDDRREVENS